jgi:hypothetical protein
MNTASWDYKWIINGILMDLYNLMEYERNYSLAYGYSWLVCF